MDNKKNDFYYFSKVINNIDIIKKYINNASLEQFLSDSRLIDAVVFRLIQIAENIRNVSANFKDNHQEIEWDDIIGFRNRIVHDYGKTDYSIVYSVVTKDLDILKNIVEQHL